jgi:hypothetical protein
MIGARMIIKIDFLFIILWVLIFFWLSDLFNSYWGSCAKKTYIVYIIVTAIIHFHFLLQGYCLAIYFLSFLPLVGS